MTKEPRMTKGAQDDKNKNVILNEVKNLLIRSFANAQDDKERSG